MNRTLNKDDSYSMKDQVFSMVRLDDGVTTRVTYPDGTVADWHDMDLWDLDKDAAVWKELAAHLVYDDVGFAMNAKKLVAGDKCVPSCKEESALTLVAAALAGPGLVLAIVATILAFS